MDAKYLAEIKTRCELGRPAQQREVKALLAEVERLQNVVKIQRASCNLVEMAKAATIVDGIVAKDQQIATLETEKKRAEKSTGAGMLYHVAA